MRGACSIGVRGVAYRSTTAEEAEASETVSVAEAFRLRPPTVKTRMGGGDGDDDALY